MKQINTIQLNTYTEQQISNLPKWDDDQDFPALVDPRFQDGHNPIESLEKQGVFFSEPVDLDLMMLATYPEAYAIEPAEPRESPEPDRKTIVAVLGKRHVNEGRLPEDLLRLFDDYHAKFDLGSKLAAHLAALADLNDEQLLENLPNVLDRLVQYVRASLHELPE